MKVKEVVLLLDDLAPGNEWKLAKITEVYPGSDDRGTVFLERPKQKVVTLFEAD